jgi:hypothetical protein
METGRGTFKNFGDSVEGVCDMSVLSLATAFGVYKEKQTGTSNN